MKEAPRPLVTVPGLAIRVPAPADLPAGSYGAEEIAREAAANMKAAGLRFPDAEEIETAGLCPVCLKGGPR